MADQVRMVVVTDPSLEVATATMRKSEEIVYTGHREVLQPVVDEAIAGKKDQRAAFQSLMKRGWSNAYLMIDLTGSTAS